MKGMTDEQVLGFNAGIIEEFRSNAGVLGGMFEGNPTLLLTMTGAKSDRTLTSPLTYHTDGDDLIVMASAGGDPKHPARYFNITANPEVEVEVLDQRFAARAEQLDGADRQRVYDSLVAAMPRFADYQAEVDREIPLFRLVRT